LPKTDAQAVPDAVWSEVAKVRGAVLETIAAFVPPGTNFVFTYAGANEDPADRKPSRNIARLPYGGPRASLRFA